MRIQKSAFVVVMVVGCALAALAQRSPNSPSTNFSTRSISGRSSFRPTAHSVVIEAERADWDQQIFRSDLWLYHDDGKGGSLIQLTQSGHDSDPKWSPDGRWIAFLSERKSAAGKEAMTPIPIPTRKTSQRARSI